MVAAVRNKPVYRMSSAGYCPRALSAERLNYPCEAAPDWLERAANEGRWHELRLVQELRDNGYVIQNTRNAGTQEQVEVALDFPAFRLIGHVDGIIHNWGNGHNKGTNKVLLEIKSMSLYEFDRWMKGRFVEFPNYAAQITCYLKATGLPEALYLVKNRSSGYIDRQVITPPVDFDEIIAKLNRVEECVQAGTLAEVDFNPDSIECRRCDYKTLCTPAPTSFEAVPESVLFSACETWRKGTAMKIEGELLVEEAKKHFLSQTEATGQKKWRFDELVILKIEVKESTSYPKAKLLEVFTEEQLKPVAEIKLPYGYLKITDGRGEGR